MKGCRPLSDQEIAAVEPLLSPRDRCLFVVAVRTGFRISELLSLTIGDVWQAGKVPDHLAVARRHMKKKAEGRTVVLHPGAKAALEAWIDKLGPEADPAGPLFPSRIRRADGVRHAMTRQAAWRSWKAAFKAAGLTGKVACHSTRKAFAAKVYRRLKGDLVKTQKALGHKSVSSTVSYIAFDDAEVDSAILGD